MGPSLSNFLHRKYKVKYLGEKKSLLKTKTKCFDIKFIFTVKIKA